MKNLIFIGMVGSKMKTIAEKAANSLSRKFVDTDEVITRNIGMSLHDFYTLFPLDSFRDITYRLALQLSQGEDYVVAVGDSILKNPDAINSLRETAFSVYIDQSIESITAECSEPAHPLLARGLSRLPELFNERKQLFCDYADITVDYDENTLDEVLLHYNKASATSEKFDAALHAFFRYYIETKYPTADSVAFADECSSAISKILEKYTSEE